jgi:Protein of unknown function, DUF481
MKTLIRILLALATLTLAVAQTNKPAPDEIVFTNGDKLVGHFVRATGTQVTFKSDILGDLTIDWKKVKELRTSVKVAVVPKSVTLREHGDTSNVAQGTLAMEDQKLQITPAAGGTPQSIPVGDAAVVVEQPEFEKAVTSQPNFFKNWKGTITAGGALVEATQDSESFTGAIALLRTEPSENWLDPRNRTSLIFSESFGEVTQPNTPTVKTAIFHADVRRDQFFSKSWFAFGEATFDHNYSQGLNLSQTYNGGIGWIAVKTTNQELDLKGSVAYIQQQFASGPEKSLIGAVFAEHYNRKLTHGIALDENGSVTPAWNNTNAYSAAFAALLTMPVYKRLSGSTGIIDTFLNDPPAGFKKNSFQFTLGLTYVLQ